MRLAYSVSAICSGRTGRATLYSDRVKFTWQLKRDMPGLDIFGHGVRGMVDKAEALDLYAYLIVLEN